MKMSLVLGRVSADGPGLGFGLCTVFLQDGRKIDCQMGLDLLGPDPRVNPVLKF